MNAVHQLCLAFPLRLGGFHTYSEVFLLYVDGHRSKLAENSSTTESAAWCLRFKVSQLVNKHPSSTSTPSRPVSELFAAYLANRCTEFAENSSTTEDTVVGPHVNNSGLEIVHAAPYPWRVVSLLN